jgi:hypothetical protein
MTDTWTDTAINTRVQKAHRIVDDADLDTLIDRHQQAIDAYMQARRQHTEARRLFQDAGDHCGDVELEALLEMEQDPEYVPGKNAEARKQQAEVFLAKHHGVAAARHRLKSLHRGVDETALEADHAKQRIDHLELQVAARRSELDLIASFARGAS